MKTPKKWLHSIVDKSDLEQAVQAELEYDQSIGHVGRVDVEASDGLITITGTVYSLAQKWAVEHAVRRVAGVLEVSNELDIDPPKEIFHTDQDLADAVSTVLEWTAGAPDGIGVSVLDGSVRLDGTVGTFSERVAAGDTVRRMVGVKAVDNRLAVAEIAAADDIRAAVEHAIRRHTGGIDITDVSVDYDDGTVTLEGLVRSWAVRARAEEAARIAPGVKAVVNHLALQGSMAATP